MADWSGVLSKSSRAEMSMRDEDLQEEDVWAVVKEREDPISSPRVKRKAHEKKSSGPGVIPWATNSSNDKMGQQSSAPVTDPDWSKFCKNSSKKATRDYGPCMDDGDVDGGGEGKGEGDGDDDDDDEMVPPHEYIARRLARTQISSFSMCEGAGRTLKGRDLRKLRNDILTKTGFLE